MRNLFLLLFSFLFLLAMLGAAALSGQGFPHPKAGRRFYLDAVSGNDQHSGRSAGKAWKTLERVNRQVLEPGDQLLIKANTEYFGQLKPQGRGSRQQPIRVDQYGIGSKPRIAAQGQYTAALYIYNTEYMEVKNLDLSNQGGERQPKRYGVQVELSDFGTARHIRLENLDVHDVNGSLVKKEGGGAGIVVMNGGRQNPSRYDGLAIENCTVKRCGRNGILVNGNWRRNAWLPNLNVVIRRNLLEGVPGDGIVPTGCDGALVEYNVMRDCPRLLPRGEAAAGIWPWSSDNTLIQYNEVSDHKAPWDGQGFDSDWNCRNTIIQYNYSHDNEGGFLLVCNDGSAAPANSVGNLGTIVRYNVSLNDGSRTQGQHAGFSPVFHLAGPTRNTRIYNNVVVVTRRGPGLDSTLVNLDTWHGYADSTLFANNIFYAEGGVKYLYGQSRRNYFENNLYYGRHHDRPADPGAVTEAPGFLSLPLPAPAGFRDLQALKLTPASPAIGRGKALVPGPVKDFFGNPVLPGRQPAIGIYEPKF